MSTRVKVIILTLFLAAGTAPAAWAEGENSGKSANDKQQQEEVMCENQNEQTLESLNDSIKSLRASIDDLNKRIIAIKNERSEAEGLSFENPHLIAICSLLLSVVALLTSVVAEIQLFRKNRKEQPAKEEPTDGDGDKKTDCDFKNFNRSKDSKSSAENPAQAETKGEEPDPKDDGQKTEAEQKEGEMTEPSQSSVAESDEPNKESESDPAEQPKPEIRHVYKAYNTDGSLKGKEDGRFEVDEDNKTFRYIKDLDPVVKVPDNYRGVIKVTGDKNGKPMQIEGKIEIKTSGKKWDIVAPIIIEFK